MHTSLWHLVGALASCLTVPAWAADRAGVPPEVGMVSLASARGSSPAPGYWAGHEEGWFWYQDPPAEVEDKVPAPPPAPKDAKAPEIRELERLQKELEDARKIAVINPTERNVYRYLELEARMVRQASYFGDVAQRVGILHPELDTTHEGRPVNSLAIPIYEREAEKGRVAKVGELGTDHALFFFFRSDCPYCHAYAPVLKAFAEQYGIAIVAVSLDGGGLPEFPSPRKDNGIARNLKVTQVPATFLANPFSGDIVPLGLGVLSSEELLERISIVSQPAAGEAPLGALGSQARQ